MGARKFDRIDGVAKVCTVLIFATWIIVGGLTMLFAPQLLRLYTSEPAVIELGAMKLYVLMTTYFTLGIMNVFPGISRGMGYSVMPMIATLVGACLLRVVWIYTFFAWHRTAFMLFLCYPITWLISGCGQIAIFLYARKQVRKKFPAENVLPVPQKG